MGDEVFDGISGVPADFQLLALAGISVIFHDRILRFDQRMRAGMIFVPAVIAKIGCRFLNPGDFLGKGAIQPYSANRVIAADLGPADVRFRDAGDRSRRRNVEICW